ncbi:O-antigen ligase family protein [Veillonella agrestimuris]|uniref:O-antigen ligase family protein n=1 Tax=Veillonella agrestimuris TaxID=2941340 RepID=UPI00203F9945|nr:O-antigen ligase family protein [Veillonella agrestimuris]
MNPSIRDGLFYLIVLFTIFTQIPKILQLNFIGGFLGTDLSFYPILIGVLYSFYIIYKNKSELVITRDDKIWGIYIVIYIGILLISFIHGLVIYPYYDVILSGPVTQVEKLPMIQKTLASIGIHIDANTLLMYSMVLRPIKIFVIECFWYFTVPYMIYSWYKFNINRGIRILVKGTYGATIIVCIYSILDILYLWGNFSAEHILSILNPVVHEISSNGTWWPPLFWNNQLRSVFAEPSFYGIFAAFAMPILWYKLIEVTNNKERIINMVVIFMFNYGLFLTRARTATILLLIELLVLIFFTIWNKEKTFIKNTVLVLFCSLLAFGGAILSLDVMPGSPQSTKQIYEVEKKDTVKEYVTDNIASAVSTDKRSNRARLSIIESSVEIGKQHPLLGVGTGFRSSYTPDYLSTEALNDPEVQSWIQYQKERGLMQSGFPNLSEYAVRFAEGGILGLLIFLVAPVYLGFKLLKEIFRTKNLINRTQLIFFFISFLGIMVTGLINNLSITCCYYILMGLGYALIKNQSA